MASGGYIKLWRKTLSWRWHDDPIVLAFFIYCLLNAAYEPSGYHRTDTGVGEFSASLAKMAADTGLSVDQVRKSIDKLIDTQEIAKEVRNGCTVIKVLKYAEYQGIESDEDPSDRTTKSHGKAHAKAQANAQGSSYIRRKKKKEYISPYIPQEGDKKKGDPDGEDNWYHFPYITDEVPDD